MSEHLPRIKKSALRLLALPARRRFWIGLLIVGLWVSVMGRIWMRESGREGMSLRQIGISPEVLLVSWVDYNQWMWIEQNGRRIGLTRISISPLSRSSHAQGQAKGSVADPPGYLLLSKTRLDLRVMGIEMPVEIATQVEMNAAFELNTLQALVEAAGQRFLMQGFVEDRSLYYRVKHNPDSGPKIPENPSSDHPRDKAPSTAAVGLLGNSIFLGQRDVCGQSPLSEPIFLSEALIPILTRAESLKPGLSWSTKASDPLQGLFHTTIQVRVERKEKLTVEDETIETWRLTEKVGSMSSTVWYDLRGRILRREMDEGRLLLTQANPSKALAIYKNFDLPYRFPIIDRPGIKKSIDPQLRGKPLEALLPSIPGL